MNMIHIADPSGNQQRYEIQEACRLWNEGTIDRNARYWQEGMPEWRPVAEFFNSSPAQPGQIPLPPVTLVPLVRRFVKDPTRLTRFLLVLLWAYIAAASASALLAAISLATGQASAGETDELTIQDIAVLIVALPQMLISTVTMVVFMMWIYRANRNARGLGAEDMTFTPGWSVGWFFIPIANLWKPYQAMKQIWQASADPASWQSQKPPTLLSNWWALWILSNVLSNASFRLSFRAHTASELLASEIVSLISDLVNIPLCLLAMRLVRQIIRLQTQWTTQGNPSACDICRQPMPSSEIIFLNNTWVCAGCKPIVLQQMQQGIVRN